MKHRWVFLFLFLLVIGVIAWNFSRPITNAQSITLYGNVDVRQVDISFRVPGQVDKVLFEEGDIVTKGTLVTTLDKTPYDSQVQKAASQVVSTRAQLELAEILLKRREEVVGVGAVSQESVDQARYSRDALQALLNENEAALAVAIDNLSYTEAFAPTDCVVLTRIREPGTVVKASDPVYTLSVISPVWIRAFVNETDLGNIYYGMPAEVTTDSNRTYKGQIGFISPVAEFTPKTVETAQLRTDLVYRLRIYVDNFDKYLKQGMPVTVRLQEKETTSEHTG